MSRARFAASALLSAIAMGVVGAAAGATVGTNAADAQRVETLLLRQPSVSASHLAFVWGGDIWLSNRRGQQPQRLTSDEAAEFAPQFSPDGQWVAYSATHEGNTDVYVVPVQGGLPRRLTWHPGADVVNGWSRDGKRILFASNREVANNRSNQLYEVALAGGFERKLMEAVAFEGAWSKDGKRLAYRPYRQAYSGPSGWRQHRGGTTPPIWILDPATQSWEQIPHVNATDSNPVWVGDEVVFISDRNDGAANLFAWDPKTKALRQLTRETQWDVRSVGAHGTTLVYEVGGRLKELDLAAPAAAPRELPIAIAGTAAPLRAQWKDASRTITSAELSATGKRVLVSARGDVFSVPVKDGSVRNLTATSGVREKDAQWSPDGQRVAYISDAPGMQHQLVVRDQLGREPARTWPLGKTGYFTLLDWSPDGQRLVLRDNHLNLYAFALETGGLSKIDSSLRRSFGGGFKTSFTADGRWLAYTATGANHLSQVRLHDFAGGKSTAVSDGQSHADNPAFSPKGDVLFFTASVNSGPFQVGLDMSTQERARRMGIYAAVLAADGKSPLFPRPGDEEPRSAAKSADAKSADADKTGSAGAGTNGEIPKNADAADKAPDKAPPFKPVRIDVDGLQQRIVALPLPERFYDNLVVGADGALFYLERRQPGTSLEAPEAEQRATAELHRFDFEERKEKMLRANVAEVGRSADAKKLLLTGAKGKLEIADASEKLDAKTIDTSGLRMRVDARAEWRQIFDETWWMQKEFFYDPGLHRIDWQGVYDRYLPLLAHVQRREDLNDLLVEMIAELQVGHNRVGGGDVHQEPGAQTGLLGADIAVEQGRYRIAKIYAGDRWNPFLKAPLAAPGVAVRTGDFIIAVNNQQLDAYKDNLYAALEGTVGRQLSLTVSADAAGKGARTVVVEPISNEAGLRQWDWVERNRQYVDRQTGGKVAYVYLPDTAAGGFQYFNRMFFAQVDKQAVIVDDRRNGGGQAANYVIDVLNRPYLGSWKDRDGLVFDTPGGAIYGPKAMLIDQDAGSGGDFLPYAFKRTGLGPLIGKRTWGGLIGISANPNLIDGGFLVVPYFRFYTPEGEWRIENEGVAPDLEVELDPAGVNKGRDSQLDAAIESVMTRLKTWQPIQRQAPAMPTEAGK